MREEDDPSSKEETDLFSDSSADAIFGESLQSMRQNAVPAWQPLDPPEAWGLHADYEVLGLLGRGGMGAVYQVRQKSLDRLVALKLLPLEISADRTFVERFTREARTLARLHHEAIVAVHDFGQTRAGHFYFVMEFIEGTDLAQMIHGPGLKPMNAIEIVARICEALQYAHDKGVVHRDIKPANILVSREGQVKVADFGLARSLVPGAENGGHTSLGLVMGTPAYMAPEQLHGMEVDGRTDIYALGVMLYEMLCGEVPRGAYQMPSQRAGVDARLDHIVAKAMCGRPGDRYQSAGEMRAELNRIATTAPRHSSRFGPLSPAKKRLVWVAVAALAVVAAGALTLRGHFAVARGRGGTPRPAVPSAATATRTHPFVNSLEMKFVPVPIKGGSTNGERVLFGVWKTRVQDYTTFAMETGLVPQSPEFAQGPTHPVVNVSWNEAQAFCEWLTRRERQSGTIAPGQSYRLPTDHEWSCAAGIGDREDAARWASEETGRIADSFPWGSAWPPPPGSGNFSGQETAGHRTGHQQIIPGYRDDFPETSPVGSFSANEMGLFDLAGNAAEWCDDWFNAREDRKVVRSSAFTASERSVLLSSMRSSDPPEVRGATRGFRVVLATDLSRPKEALTQASAPATPAYAPATAAPPIEVGDNWLNWVTSYRGRFLHDASVEDVGTGLVLKRSFFEPVAFTRGIALRATWVSGGSRPATLFVRSHPAPPADPNSYYAAAVEQGVVRLYEMRNVTSTQDRRILQEWPAPATFNPQAEQVLELRVADDRLTVRLNGQHLGSVRDGALTGLGGSGFTADTGTAIRKFEYQSLDMSIDYPPGTVPVDQWRMLAPDAGADQVFLRPDGWKQLLKPGYMEGPPLADGAVRGRFRYAPDRRLWLLLRDTAHTSQYRAEICAGGATAAISRVTGAPGAAPTVLGNFDLPRRLFANDEYGLEFRAAGDQLTLYFDGEMVGSVRDANLQKGQAFLFSDGITFHDLTWGNFIPRPPGMPLYSASPFIPSDGLPLQPLQATATDLLGTVEPDKDCGGGTWRKDSVGWTGLPAPDTSSLPLRVSPPLRVRGSYRLDAAFTLPVETPSSNVLLLLPVGNGRIAALRLGKQNSTRGFYLCHDIGQISGLTRGYLLSTPQQLLIGVEVHAQENAVDIRTQFRAGFGFRHRGTLEELALEPGQATEPLQAWAKENRLGLLSYWPITWNSLRVQPIEGGSVERLLP